MIVKKSIILNEDKLEDTIREYDKKLKEIQDTLRELSNSVGKIDGQNEIWNSDTQKSVYSGYHNIERKYDGIIVKLTAFSEHLKKVLRDHREEEKLRNTTLENNESNMNVN